MGKLCIICKDTYDDTKPFHLVPTEPRKRQIWLKHISKVVNIEILPKTPYVCSAHFSPKDYRDEVSLKPAALPNLAIKLNNSDTHNLKTAVLTNLEITLNDSLYSLPEIKCEETLNWSNLLDTSAESSFPMDTQSSSLAAEENTQERKLLKRKTYLGDFTREDLKDARIAKRFYDLAIKKIAELERDHRKLKKEVKIARRKKLQEFFKEPTHIFDENKD